MPKINGYTCPICGGMEHHQFDCHFTGMSREQAIVRLIPDVRLSPDAKQATCSDCGKTWDVGTDPDCAPCEALWTAIEAEWPDAD